MVDGLFFSIFLWAFIGPFFLCVILTGLIAVGGIVVAPAVAGVCVIEGRAKGMSPWNATRLGITGYVYSLMLGFPGLFLVMGIKGRNISLFHIRMMYVLPFGVGGGPYCGL